MKECQKAGWTKKAHKTDCEVLRNVHLRRLFIIHAKDVHDRVRVPAEVAAGSSRARPNLIEPYSPRVVGLAFFVVLVTTCEELNKLRPMLVAISVMSAVVLEYVLEGRMAEA